MDLLLFDPPEQVFGQPDVRSPQWGRVFSAEVSGDTDVFSFHRRVAPLS